MSKAGKQKGLAALLVVFMLLMMLPTASFASGFTDMPDDWSKTALENAVSNGLLKGDNGKIMPKDNLTRAQMAAVVNRAFGTTEKASLSKYTDVAANAWYYNDMAKAVQMGTFEGSGNKLNPNNSITREEAFVVLARAFKLSGASESALNKFSDKASVSQWAKDGVASLVSAGYVAGSNGKLNPKSYITRAEFAKMMDNLLKKYINAAGTYDEDITGNVMINVADVVLKDITVAGDLIIGDGVGDGDVTLDSVVVTGRTVIRGGGVDSIKIIGNSKIQNIVIARVNGQLRVFSEDGTEIGEVIVDGKDDVIIEGNVGSVAIIASDVTVNANDAQIASVTIEGTNSNIVVGANSTIQTATANAANSTITASAGSRITNVVVNADGANVTGAGNVGAVAANANNVSVSTTGTKVTAGEGTEGVKAGNTNVSPGTTVNTTPPSSSSGGGGDTRPTVSAISVTATVDVDGTAVDVTGDVYEGNTVNVALSSNGTTIYYTTDGSEPTTASDVYSTAKS